MNVPATKISKKPAFYAITALFLLITAPSAAAIAPPNAPESGSIASLFGICLVSMGGLIFILAALKHLNLSRKPNKNFSHPVLLDRIKDAQRIQLQKQITEAGHAKNPVSDENESRKFDHPSFDQPEETTEKVEELLHAMSGTQDDDFSEESLF